MKSISVCMVVKNEELMIGHGLDSVRGLADEVVVVDTGSTDRTVEKAREAGARVIDHHWDGSLGKARNAYLRAACGDWVLVLDGDETIARSDLAKIRRLVERRGVIGYCLAVRNYTNDYDLMWNWHPNDRSYPREEKLSSCHGWMKTQPLRLFRNFRDLRYAEGSSVHTSPISSLRKHRGRIENQDDVVVHHFQYLKGGDGFISRKQRLRLEGEINHLKQFPGDPHACLNVAKTLFAEKRDEEALKYLSRAVKLDASFHDAYQLWGMIEIENGRMNLAEKRLRQAVRINSASADAWALLGVALVEACRFREAMRALKKAISLRPQHLLAHNSLGVLYEELGMYGEARGQYRTALELHPKFGPARENLERLTKADGNGAGKRAGE
ncbi:MAG: glycosyltransferase [Acidobacteria bacterium]|nr:glycosyltransferase [Acidobacteriota bacterium]